MLEFLAILLVTNLNCVLNLILLLLNQLKINDSPFDKLHNGQFCPRK